MAGSNVPAGQAPVFVAVGKKYGIPPAVLAGIADVESNFGANAGPSSAGAIGEMQFLPSTAASLGVNPLVFPNAVDGTARLLISNGYRSNPTRAIAAYNAGLGNYQAGLGYASQVLADATRLGPQLGGVTPANLSSSTGTNPAQAALNAAGGSSFGGLSGWLLKALLTVSLVAAGAALTGVGARTFLGRKTGTS